MRALWAHLAAAAPSTKPTSPPALAEVAGRALRRELAAWVHGTAELPLDELLARPACAGSRSAGLAAALGLRVSEGALSGVQVKMVLARRRRRTAPASAGDEFLAVDGWRIRRLDDALAWVERGQPFELLLVREQRVLTLSVPPPAAEAAARRGMLLTLARSRHRAPRWPGAGHG